MLPSLKGAPTSSVSPLMAKLLPKNSPNAASLAVNFFLLLPCLTLQCKFIHCFAIILTPREQHRNAWISEETWRLVDERFTMWRKPQAQTGMRRLGRAIQASMKGDRKQRAADLSLLRPCTTPSSAATLP